MKRTRYSLLLLLSILSLVFYNQLVLANYLYDDFINDGNYYSEVDVTKIVVDCEDKIFNFEDGPWIPAKVFFQYLGCIVEWDNALKVARVINKHHALVLKYSDQAFTLTQHEIMVPRNYLKLENNTSYIDVTWLAWIFDNPKRYYGTYKEAFELKEALKFLGIKEILAFPPSQKTDQKEIELIKVKEAEILNKINPKQWGIRSPLERPEGFVDYHIFAAHNLDLNGDGMKDQIYYLAYTYGSIDWFNGPGYIVYTFDNGITYQTQELDLSPPIDLLSSSVPIKYADLNNDECLDIIYSLEYPQPEHCETWPNILIQDKSGRFSTIDICNEYGYLIRSWSIAYNDQIKSDLLRLDIKKYAYDQRPKKQYFIIEDSQLVNLNSFSSANTFYLTVKKLDYH